MALLETEVTSRPSKRAAPTIDHHVQIRNVHTMAEGVRHKSNEIQELIQNQFLHNQIELTMKFVSLKHIDLSPADLVTAVENPHSTLRSHKNIISVLIKYTEHMNNSGEIQKIAITALGLKQESENSVKLKQLIHNITTALGILKVEIDDFLTGSEGDIDISNQDNTADDLWKAFLSLEETLHNETIRAFGVSSGIEEAMNHMCNFYKAYENSLIQKSG